MVQTIVVPDVIGLEPGEAKRFVFDELGERADGFVMRVKTTPDAFTDAFEGFVAYRNRCPHIGICLDMGDARFWAPDIQRIVCSMHGASFRAHDGLCDGGPCLGDRLEAFPLTVRDDGAAEVQVGRD